MVVVFGGGGVSFFFQPSNRRWRFGVSLAPGVVLGVAPEVAGFRVIETRRTAKLVKQDLSLWEICLPVDR